MKWKVKIFFAPFVQEEPEEFEDPDFERILRWLNNFPRYALNNSLRKIEITKASDAPQK